MWELGTTIHHYFSRDRLWQAPQQSIPHFWKFHVDTLGSIERTMTREDRGNLFATHKSIHNIYRSTHNVDAISGRICYDYRCLTELVHLLWSCIWRNEKDPWAHQSLQNRWPMTSEAMVQTIDDKIILEINKIEKLER